MVHANSRLVLFYWSRMYRTRGSSHGLSQVPTEHPRAQKFTHLFLTLSLIKNVLFVCFEMADDVMFDFYSNYDG